LKADIVHAQGNADYIFAAVEAEIPHIITVHGIFKNEFNVAKSKFSIKDVVKKIITKRAEQYYSRRIKHLICITKEVEKFVQSASPNVKIYRINNAIDERFFSLLDESKVSAPVVLFVAAITYRKGLHFLMEAFTQIFKDMPHASLRIVGMFDWDAEYVKDLHRKYKEYIDNGSMTFLGAVSREQLYKDFSRCSVFCLPSLAESAPMVISQALAAGKPVVASAVGGLPNMVLHCETGFLVNPGNVEDIYDALKRTLTDEDNRRRMGKKAREFAKEQYSSSSVALKTLEAYYDVIAKTAV
jgi:glycosyltransferase involved in cell wall biosynthesis